VAIYLLSLHHKHLLTGQGFFFHATIIYLDLHVSHINDINSDTAFVFTVHFQLLAGFQGDGLIFGLDGLLFFYLI